MIQFPFRGAWQACSFLSLSPPHMRQRFSPAIVKAPTSGRAFLASLALHASQSMHGDFLIGGSYTSSLAGC